MLLTLRYKPWLKMPYRRADAPPTVPDEETIEWLLNHQNLESKRSRTTKMLDELSEEERNQTGLVKLGERTKTVQGDPFGTFPAWAGNVAHPTHYRMVGLSLATSSPNAEFL